MNRHGLTILLLGWPALLGPAAAAECILDEEAFVLRSALPDDAAIIDAQSAGSYGWFASADPIAIGEHRYGKSGAPLAVAPADLDYYALKDGVPFFRPTGSADDPPAILYASVDPTSCEVQGYQLAE